MEEEGQGEAEEESDGAEGDEAPNVQLLECSSCGRKFVEAALERHVKICDKVFGQKRKVREGVKTTVDYERRILQGL
jgi:hypothetical protein